MKEIGKVKTMSIENASQFIAQAIQDQTLLNKVQQATGISGNLTTAQVSDDQYNAASRLGQQEGFDFSAAEIKDAFENFTAQLRTGESELAEAELDMVAGGVAKANKVTKIGPPLKAIQLPSQPIR